MTHDYRHMPRGHSKTSAGKEWAKAQQVTATITDVSLEAMSLISGVRLLDLIPTPQNRDAQRRATLEQGPELENVWDYFARIPAPSYNAFAATIGAFKAGVSYDLDGAAFIDGLIEGLDAVPSTSLTLDGGWSAPDDGSVELWERNRKKQAEEPS